MKHSFVFLMMGILAAPCYSNDPPKAGEVRESEIATGVKMKFCWIPAGKAMLGAPANEAGRFDNEKERAFTTVGFWLGKYEVTQDEYEAVMGENPSGYRLPKPAAGKLTKNQKGSGRNPVERVSWYDCQRFIKNCGVDGYKLALPHDDEWEYACRGGKGNQQPFYWGDKSNGDKANNDGTRPYGTDEKGRFMNCPIPVGSYEEKAPHPWGLCDMLGNVSEWCDNAESLGFRMIRGGSWRHPAAFCRSASRIGYNANTPFRGTTDPKTGSETGFRVALFPSK